MLTVREHLLFYARVKGFPISNEKEHVDQILLDVGLSDDQHKLAKELSGGMKRRLSIGISFTGNPSVIMLDEPTTGLDPSIV
jgi:ABC-type multidrug transport system ATPase subunit